MLFVMIPSPTLLGKQKRRTHDVARKSVQDSDILVYRSIMVSPECHSSHQSDRINTFCSGNRDFFQHLLVTFHPPNTYIIKDLIELRIISIYIPKGSIPLTKSMAKEVENGKIVQTPPEIEFEDVCTRYSHRYLGAAMPSGVAEDRLWRCCLRRRFRGHRSQTTSRFHSGLVLSMMDDTPLIRTT